MQLLTINQERGLRNRHFAFERKIPRFSYTDENNPGCAVMTFITPQKAFPSRGNCALCFHYFKEPGIERYPHRWKRLRKVPCPDGHALCLKCLWEYFMDRRRQILAAEARGVESDEIPRYTCPCCFTPLEPFLKSNQRLAISTERRPSLTRISVDGN